MVNYCIVGSGRQGTAAAYDIIKFASPKTLTVIDVSVENLNRCEEIIKRLTSFDINKIALDISSEKKMIEALQNIDIFLTYGYGNPILPIFLSLHHSNLYLLHLIYKTFHKYSYYQNLHYNFCKRYR